MPSKKSNVNIDYKPDPFPNSVDTDLLDQEPTPRTSRKKNKNVKQTARVEPEISDPEVAREPSVSPPASNQIPRGFPHRSRDPGRDGLEDLTATEKVSDDHTPPQDTFLSPASTYGRSPPADLLLGFSHRPSPPTQSYIGKGGFNARSPPTSPPLAKARPISYGGPPTTVGYTRTSTSPYAHPASAFGSPPPHMPQAHFYEARDIDLGLGQRLGLKSQPPTLVKFASLAGVKEARNAILVGTANQLDVLGYEGDKVLQLGSLRNIPGVIHDATLLTWSRGQDPFQALRPLVALTVHGSHGDHIIPNERPPDYQSRRGSAAASYATPPQAGAGASTSVVVYSLRQQCLIADLLHLPSTSIPQVPSWMDKQQKPAPSGRLKLQTSGDHLLVSSGVSGEVFVFGIRQNGSEANFICLEKLWTTLQPRMRRRESSHSRPNDQDVSPADINRGEVDQEQAIVSLSGRWLAYCPALASRPSIGAVVGESVLCVNGASLSSRSAPARPVINCTVDSPDVETIFGKVAKGVAQEMLKGGKWLGEKGAQYWQQYWNQDTANRTPSSQQSPIYSPQQAPLQFPPTHGEPADATTKEPELVSIVDLQALQLKDGKKSSDFVPLATFEPPGGCSYLSFTPNGLCLLTASRRGDIYYVWDLLQVRYPRISIIEENEAQIAARVRQVHKNERFSESVIVDVEWEAPLGIRYAVVTQNRTVHMFDIPSAALRWPPPRARKKKRPVSIPADPASIGPQPPASSFFASAMNFATTKTQPMLANLRGRAPSMGGGVSGIGNTGLGYASATGMRSGKVVAAGFSKSLGAATNTVASIRHAGQSKLHLKMETVAGRLAWTYRDRRLRLSVLDSSGIRNYYVRKTNPRERQPETVSVFDSRKSVNVKLPEIYPTQDPEEGPHGFWQPSSQRPPQAPGFPAPLSFAEIDTNAPYQPFHSDSRVTMSVFPTDLPLSESQFPTASAIFHPRSDVPNPRKKDEDRWVFGLEIPTVRLNTGSPERNDHEEDGYRSVVYRETTLQQIGEEGEEQIVSTTRRRKAKKGKQARAQQGDTMTEDGQEGEEGFFEDDCDVLDFAEDRV
ncbi:uncharacterized protein HMPREF1541_07932 [Cyphellophora europaea CBS 101466]|uniref:BCAS3 domain-containing protein n=1 Tax=Cyphellophora europaea (strain CBS 101466) TaxID=1220924 RepID=W2RKV8_CYPE1|nr:uncharacterized protein HMPREF1541_07932 [Cyphellophora europaea CBS 101466]ETN36945.1 hypothetical protein HMPREF1541_07932 [Cyphellophora europaea CBS 101466]